MIFRTELLKNNIIKKGSLLILIIQLLFGVLASIKGDVNSYFTTFLVSFVACELVLLYGISQGANQRVIWSVITLLNIGICIQNILGQTSSEKTAGIMFVSLVITVCYAFFDKNYLVDKKFAMYFTSGLGIIASLFLIIFGESINGTKAWLTLGGISLQMSDVIKLTFIYFIALLYSSDFDESTKFKMSSVYLIIISALMVLMNELGTILVVFSVYITFVIMYIQNKKYKLIVLSCVLAGVFAISIMYLFTINYSELLENIGLSKVRIIFEKITERISIWINYDGSKYEDYGYQALKAKQAALIGGWFGTSKYTIHIPVAASDFVFPAILMKLGLVFGLTVIILFFNIYYRINYAKSMLKVASITALCFQAFIMIAGSINFFVMTGLGVPFLSSGGTNTLITYLLVYNILSRSDMTYEK